MFSFVGWTKKSVSMSIAPAIGSNPSLSSSSVPRRTCVVGGRPNVPTTQYSSYPQFSPSHDRSLRISVTHFAKRPIWVCRVSSSEQSNSEEGGGVGDGEEAVEYEVELDKPYGLKFAKGRDGGTYIDTIAPGGTADISGKFTVGDKVIATR